MSFPAAAGVTASPRPGAYRRVAWLWPAGAFALPLFVAVALGVGEAVDADAWARLVASPALVPALGLSLWVGLASTLAALGLTLWLVTHLYGGPGWARLQSMLGAFLAVPHAAFAVGLALLMMPSGLIARGLALVTGWDAPPDVATVHDPVGLALIAALVLKEVPFLLWAVLAQLQRVGQGAALERQMQVAQAMGYTAARVWWRVLWPQLMPRLALPLLAVWAYGLTVVDMAIVLGPTRPPTLALLAWTWLLDADPALNRQGAAAALLLTAVMAAGALAGLGVARLLRAPLCRWRVNGRRGRRSTRLAAAPSVALFGAALYAIVFALLGFVSFASVWTFPSLWPQQLGTEAWSVLAGSGGSLALTAWLALVSAATGVGLAVAWLESTPPHWDARAAPLVFAPMLLPGLLLVAGLYRLTLLLGLDGRVAGLWLAHSLFTTPYALVTLAPAYRSFDPRYEQTAHALGRGSLAFLWRVKWPMLRAPIASAFAVGFAVSVTQYLSTQFVGAGRHATLTTEALTLASGGQRPLMAAFALLQALLPALVFTAALALGQRQARRMAGAGV